MALDIGNLISRKGQITVEFMLLLVIMLVYITTVIQPGILTSSKAMNDIRTLGETDFAVQRIASQINYVNASASGTIKTISVYVPAKSEINCEGNSLSLLVVLGIASLNCPDNPLQPEIPGTTCKKPVSTDATLACNGFPVNGESKGKLVEIKIMKQVDEKVSLEIK